MLSTLHLIHKILYFQIKDSEPIECMTDHNVSLSTMGYLNKTNIDKVGKGYFKQHEITTERSKEV